LALFNKTKDFYVQAMQNLDESNPSLDREYAKLKSCLKLVEGFISGMTDAGDTVEVLRKVFLALNEDLGKLMDEAKRREKTSM